MSASKRFIATRDRLLLLREDLAAAQSEFAWPQLDEFNWASDYFDVISRDNDQPALRVVDDAGDGEMLTFAELGRRSSQVANWLSGLGVGHGDRILVMLGNVIELWETMLAAIRIGAVIIPATTLLENEDLADRIVRGRVTAVITHSRLAGRFDRVGDLPVRISVGEPVAGWSDYASSRQAREAFVAARKTRADDLLFLYFTSGTTARPKLVAHTHTSYPVGHLSTMYWIGLKPGDVHLNLSSPGWAKHAWSCFFAPWNAQACVLAYQYERFDPRALLDQLVRCRVTTFCAPPTVWRMLIQQDLARWPVSLREVVSAGEPLNPEVIEQVHRTWGLTIRDGYGQTETAALIGNPPGRPVQAGSMGLPLPGYSIVLLDAEGRIREEGEICIDLNQRPLSLMDGYLDDPERTAEVMRAGCYHTGDVAQRDSAGHLTYVGRMDDVFKSSDYRISPFELESVLIEHAAVAEAAVVPSPDPLRLCVPKAFVTLVAGCNPDAETARSIFVHIRGRVSAYKRIRRLEFNTLPKTISGKIRRVELRHAEQGREPVPARNPHEFWEEDFSELAAESKR
jgi:acetyl-CoA synthetase